MGKQVRRPNPLTHAGCNGAIHQRAGTLRCDRCRLVIHDARELVPHSGWVPKVVPVIAWREI